MRRSFSISLMLIPVLATPGAMAQVSGTPETFTDIHRSKGAYGRPKTVTITNGKSFSQLTEEEYRAGGYRPAYESLPTVIVRRIPVRKPIPADKD
ncbi:hypothetical protein JJB99_03525 [Bradyrhizobium diazoefficiens]|uniref:hypothetical protein n=1 Tax=Bradyrhizobium diazoefficiens TaxID=1355477 RepID=UPI00190E14FF|nr:hypothetical protein [Bradyrhizobium diazoefficiens]QQO15267.1 hypothetical protein JJB99_03525 [Bradyrhizobium diazoefficiens]